MSQRDNKKLYRKLEALRVLYLLALLLFTGVAAYCLKTALHPASADRQITAPDYQEIFTVELAESYWKATGTATTVVRNNHLPLEPSKISKLELESLSARKTYGGERIFQELARGEHAVTQFEFCSKPARLLVTRFATLAPGDEGEKRSVSVFKPNGVLLAFGKIENFPRKTTDTVWLNLDETHLERLHWRSGQDPDFRKVNEALSSLGAMRARALPDLATPDMIVRLRSTVSADFRAIQFHIRYIMFPSALLGFFAFCWGFLSWRKDVLAIEVGTFVTKMQAKFPEAQAPGFWKVVTAKNVETFCDRAMRQLEQAYLKSVAARGVTQPANGDRDYGKNSGSFLQNLKARRRQRASQLRTRFLELTGAVAGLEAHELFQQATNAADTREERNLLTRAITSQRQFLEAIAAGASARESRDSHPPSVASPSLPAETVCVTLEDEISRMFPVPDYLPSYLDAEMTRAILVVMVDPGRDMNLFGKKYRPEDGLLRDVYKQRFRKFRLPFEPAAYKTALDWLVFEGILIRGRKLHKDTYSLNNDASSAQSSAGRQLLSSVLSFHEYFFQKK